MEELRKLFNILQDHCLGTLLYVNQNSVDQNQRQKVRVVHIINLYKQRKLMSILDVKPSPCIIGDIS